MAQALLTEVGHDIGVIAHQRQRCRSRRGVPAGAKLQVADGAICFSADLRPAKVKLRLFQRVLVLLQGNVMIIVPIAALNVQRADVGL